MTAPAFRCARFRGRLLWRDVVFEIVCAEGTASALVRGGREEKKRKKKKVGGGEGRDTRSLWQREGGEGAPGSRTGIPLKHCSLSLASLRELSSSSTCLFLSPLLLRLFSYLLGHDRRRTPRSPCPPGEDDRHTVVEGGRRRRGNTAHFASLMRVLEIN